MGVRESKQAPWMRITATRCLAPLQQILQPCVIQRVQEGVGRRQDLENCNERECGTCPATLPSRCARRRLSNESHYSYPGDYLGVT